MACSNGRQTRRSVRTMAGAEIDLGRGLPALLAPQLGEHLGEGRA
jgi:hypothetical protein